jgi:plasmid stabilization system protein ParE
MPKGAYTAKQERKADHIEKSYEKRGVSKKEAEERAWRTVNKQDKGGKNAGHGRSRQSVRSRQEGLGNPASTRRRLTAIY